MNPTPPLTPLPEAPGGMPDRLGDASDTMLDNLLARMNATELRVSLKMRIRERDKARHELDEQRRTGQSEYSRLEAEARTLCDQRDQARRELAEADQPFAETITNLRAQLATVTQQHKEAYWANVEKDKIIASLVAERDEARLVRPTRGDVKVVEDKLATVTGENEALKLKWQSDTPGKPGHIFRATMRRIAELTNSGGSSRPGICFVEDLVRERDTALAECERLREALEEAPHGQLSCAQTGFCSCWKSRALNPPKA